MQQLSLLHLFGQLASLVCTVLITCLFLALLALCMQEQLFRRSSLFRVCVGFAISAAMLISSPLVYRRPGQHMAIGLATMSYMAALTVLDWCLLQPAGAVASVRGVLSSFVSQPMSGINSAYKAKERAYLQAQCSSPQHAVSPSSSTSVSRKQQQKLQTTRQLLHETSIALFRLMVMMDIISATLQCWFCYGDLSLSQFDFSSSNGQRVAAIALDYLIKGVASCLLGMQLSATYMGGRIVLICFGYPDIGPVNIFDKPWMATSISDLWSNRWHQVLRYYFLGLGYNLADWSTKVIVQLLSGVGLVHPCATLRGVKQTTHGSKGYDHRSSSIGHSQKETKAACDVSSKHQPQDQLGWYRELRRVIRTLVVFAMSGVVHEYVVWAAFGVVSGNHLAFFMLHGLAVLAEGLGAKVIEHTGVGTSQHLPMWLRRVWVVGFAYATCPLFVDVLLKNKHYQNYVPPFIVPITAVMFEKIGLCKCL